MTDKNGQANGVCEKLEKFVAFLWWLNSAGIPAASHWLEVSENSEFLIFPEMKNQASSSELLRGKKFFTVAYTIHTFFSR